MSRVLYLHISESGPAQPEWLEGITDFSFDLQAWASNNPPNEISTDAEMVVAEMPLPIDPPALRSLIHLAGDRPVIAVTLEEDLSAENHLISLGVTEVIPPTCNSAAEFGRLLLRARTRNLSVPTTMRRRRNTALTAVHRAAGDGNTPRDRIRGFARHLGQSGALSTDLLARVLKAQSKLDRRFGQVAELLGYMTAAEVLRVVTEQLKHKAPFGQICMHQNLLTMEQVDDVLQVQMDPFRLFLVCLRIIGDIPEDLLIEHLDTFGDSSGRSDSDSSTGSGSGTPRFKFGTGAGSDTGRNRGAALKHRLLAIEELSVLPAVAQKVLAMLEDETVPLERIEFALKGDPGLYAQILRTVNSAYYGGGKKNQQLLQGLVKLGTKRIKEIVLASSVVNKFMGGQEAEMKKLWRHSMLTAQWTSILMKKKDEGDADEGFIAGLLHNVGRFAIVRHFPEEWAAISELIDSGTPELDAEKEVVGLTHAEIGSFLFHNWKFSKPIVLATLHHHAPIDQLKEMTNLSPIARFVNVSSRLAHASDADDPMTAIIETDQEILDFIGVDATDLFGLQMEVEDEAQRMQQLLNV